jgi:hypothetical protein
MGRFQKGQPRLANAGRKKGTPNKLTADSREVFRLAAEMAGGVEALARYAQANPDGFWPLYAKLIPQQREHKHDLSAAALKGKTLAELEAMAKDLGLDV